MKRDIISMAIAELKRVHEAGLKFDYEMFGQLEEPEHTCGTVACAAGYLTLHPPFRARGLNYLTADNLVPVYGGEIGTYALSDFFGISIGDSKGAFIFLGRSKEEDGVGEKPRSQITALDVANKLQEYLDADAAQEIA